MVFQPKDAAYLNLIERTSRTFLPDMAANVQLSHTEDIEHFCWRALLGSLRFLSRQAAAIETLEGCLGGLWLLFAHLCLVQAMVAFTLTVWFGAERHGIQRVVQSGIISGQPLLI